MKSFAEYIKAKEFNEEAKDPRVKAWHAQIRKDAEIRNWQQQRTKDSKKKQHLKGVNVKSMPGGESNMTFDTPEDKARWDNQIAQNDLMLKNKLEKDDKLLPLADEI